MNMGKIYSYFIPVGLKVSPGRYSTKYYTSIHILSAICGFARKLILCYFLKKQHCHVNVITKVYIPFKIKILDILSFHLSNWCLAEADRL